MEKRVTSAFGWKFFERISVQGTNFLVTLLLARLLTPSDYALSCLYAPDFETEYRKKKTEEALALDGRDK